MKKMNQGEKEGLADGKVLLWVLWKRADDAFKEAIRQVVIGSKITQVALTPSFGTFCIC